jgi:hypothetical protein
MLTNGKVLVLNYFNADPGGMSAAAQMLGLWV